MLDLWRPPHGAGDAIGCLTTTFTFAPGLFDEQCLGRFLDIGSVPDREDLAYLLERETRLGGAYAGVLVDHTQAGVAHSLRWDVMPVRLPNGKQHSKLTLLAWTNHVRVIVASANLTEPGYRSNYEVGVAIDASLAAGDSEIVLQAGQFLSSLLSFVPGGDRVRSVSRAREFIERVRVLTRAWPRTSSRSRVRQHLVATLPAGSSGTGARSALSEAFGICRLRGGAPDHARVASPFFDFAGEAGGVPAALCKSMARGGRRLVTYAVPAATGDSPRPRVAAPRELVDVAEQYGATVTVELLPERDTDANPRRWHAKMLALEAEPYTTLMVGSSNFTSAGMGTRDNRNAEVNLLTVVSHAHFARDAGELQAVWPQMKSLSNLDAVEWVGAQPEADEEEALAGHPVPRGFLSVVFIAGGASHRLLLNFDPEALPSSWSIQTTAPNSMDVLDSSKWETLRERAQVEVDWPHPEPPERLLVRWDDKEGFMPVNVEDPHELPAPSALRDMSADDMLGVLAASDPSAFLRIWVRRREQSGSDGDELDSATSPELDPLRRFDLHATFLHRIRHRARVLARLRANLQRPVWGARALESRLRGLVGVEAVADRLLRELVDGTGGDEALLTLADFLIVLREVDYAPVDGALSREDFARIYGSFLRGLVRRLITSVDAHHDRLSAGPIAFWDRVGKRCLA